MSIHIGPGVLGFALLCEHVRNHLKKLCHQLEERIVGEMLEGKLTLAHVAWVCLSQDCMAITRNNLCVCVCRGGGGYTNRYH